MPLLLGGILGTIAGGALTYLALNWRAQAKSVNAATPATPSSAAGAAERGDGSSSTTPLTLRLSEAVTPTHVPSAAADASPLAALRRMRDSGAASSTPFIEARRPDEVLAAVNTALDQLVAASATARADSSIGSNGLDGADDVLPFALQTLVVLLSTQLKHPTEARYQRLNTQNANLKRLLGLVGAPTVLHALGFAEDGTSNSVRTPSSGVFWVWRGGALPTKADLEIIGATRDLLAARAAAAKIL